MSQVTVRHVGLSELDTAGAIIGRAIQNNPNIERVFAATHSRRIGALSGIYAAVLKQQQGRGIVLGAEVDGTLVGVVALVQPGRCRCSTMEKLSLMRTVQSLTSVEMALGWQKWQSAWALRDPKDAHWHIGPFAVEPEYQRQGVGLALLQATCEHIDNYPSIAYVETDSPGTVRFFELSGFHEVAEAAVMGLPNWFMVRPRQR